MRNFFLILLFALITQGMFAQNDDIVSDKDPKKLSKEEKKAQKAQQEENLKQTIKLILEQKRFVLEADNIADDKGNRITVSSSLNFIAIDSSNGVIQIGSFNGVGWNGIGGITTEGNVNKYDLEISEGKKSTSYTIMLVVMTTLGTFDINLYISDYGRADATIRSTTSGQLKFTGTIVPIDQSIVYKGTTRY